MTGKKKDVADFRNLRSPRNDGPDLAELQGADFRKLCDAREEAAKKAKTEVDADKIPKSAGTKIEDKKDSNDDGNKSGAK